MGFLEESKKLVTKRPVKTVKLESGLHKDLVCPVLRLQNDSGPTHIYRVSTAQFSAIAPSGQSLQWETFRVDLRIG